MMNKILGRNILFKSDYIFKYLFGLRENKRMLANFLSQFIRNMSLEEIYDNISYLDTEIKKKSKSDINGRLDVLISVGKYLVNT